jgi:hypothetical protein
MKTVKSMIQEICTWGFHELVLNAGGWKVIEPGLVYGVRMDNGTLKSIQIVENDIGVFLISDFGCTLNFHCGNTYDNMITIIQPNDDLFSEENWFQMSLIYNFDDIGYEDYCTIYNFYKSIQVYFL